MHITKLDHVNIRTTQVDVLTAWYTDVLGMVVGDRPNFPFPGKWLYAGDTAYIHLVGIDTPPATGSEVPLKLEHFAFRAVDAEAFEARLKDHDQRYEKAEIPEINTVAFNVWDPDGNHIHVDFNT